MGADLGGRRHLVAAAVSIGAALAAIPAARAADPYPTRSITLLTPFAAGSVTDAAARVVAQSLQDSLGQTVVVENRAGAGGMLAAQAVARATPDGYTLLLTTNSTHSVVYALYKTVPYDPIKDFTPIARIGSFLSFFAVTADKPYQSMPALVEHARANPGKLSYGVGNSTAQIAGEALNKRTGVQIQKVPYRSNPMVMTDLLGGQIQVMTADLNTGMPQLKAGRIKALAVLTRDRNPALPDVPTLSETVMPNYHLLAWVGMFGPAGMPAEAVSKLADAVQKALETAEVRARFAAAGTDLYWSGPKDFDAFVKSELMTWTDLAKEAGIQPE